MGFQINFTISDEKEREFFDFLINDCDCSILRAYSDDKDFSIDFSKPLSEPAYLIMPKSHTDNFQIEPCDINESNAKFCISPLSADGYFSPIIQYERYDGLYRIYASSSAMSADGKAQIKEILAKIKRWIKSNAKSHYREGSLICGITIYDVV